jgi:hypothetical protein
MRISSEPLDSIVADDIHQLCTDQISEGAEIEFKADLPHKDGIGKDSWYSSGPIGDRARNEIAEEVVAFANTFGGVVCIGIHETADHPKRASLPNPIPRVHELARRIRQAVYDVIDPPLPMLEAKGVELTQDGSGVVLIRVSPSRRRPHRLQSNKEVFVRRSDESVRIGMREIQELTIQAVSEATQIDTAISDRRLSFRKELNDWLHKVRKDGNPLWGGGYHLLAIPTTKIDLGRVAGRPKLTNLLVTTVVKIGPNKVECAWPPRRNAWKIGLRSITNQNTIDKGLGFTHSLRTTGECEMTLKFVSTDERPGVLAGWLAGGLGTMLSWLERVRQEAKVNVEYALALQLPIMGKPVPLIRYGDGAYGDIHADDLPMGDNEFPLVSIGGADEFGQLLQRFDEDIWNLAGLDFQQQPVTFHIEGFSP